MSKKVKIFIIAFLITGIIIIVAYLLLHKSTTSITTINNNPSYQNFNPFGAGSGTTNPQTQNNNANTNPGQNSNAGQQGNPQASKFFRITDFAVAGATFITDKRLIVNKDGSTQKPPEPTKVQISQDTPEGRKDIQTFLNNALTLKPPLVVDGKFGKKVTAAIKSFQKLNKLPETGLIDIATAPLFTKIVAVANQNIYEYIPSVRYVARMNGHIYKMFLDTKIEEELSNSTIPGIHDAFFDNTGNTVVYRYLSSDNSVSTYIATLGGSKGEFLPVNITDFSVSLDKTKYFYLTENSNGVNGMVGNFIDSEKKTVFNYPLTEWLSSWDRNNNIYLTTKASYATEGTIFSLNQTNETISKLFGRINGFTSTINPSGVSTLYSTTINGKFTLGIYRKADRSTKNLTETLPEKCIWSNDGINIYCAIPNVIIGNQYPDTWYQGLVSFDDYFAKINTQTGEKTMIANSVGETPIDGTKLFLNDKEDTLFFINKKDSTLWGLHLQ